jgi:hypothetical protein
MHRMDRGYESRVRRSPADETQPRGETLNSMASSIQEMPLTRRQPTEVPRRATPAERRSKVRYPLQMPVSFRALDRSGVSGAGRADNMSSEGIWVISEDQPNVGAQLEVRVQWPSLLDGRIPLQLITVGEVARRSRSGFAVLFRQHQFRTMGSKVIQSPSGQDQTDYSALRASTGSTAEARLAGR